MSQPNFWDIPSIFREQRGKIMAALSYYCGVEYLSLIEDAIQETFYAALKTWPTNPPDDPLAWLIKVSRNKAINEIKKDVRFNFKNTASQSQQVQLTGDLQEELENADWEEGQLKMLFILSNLTEIAEKKRLMLILKLVCGFDGEQIARSLLMNREAVFKNLQRMISGLEKQSFRQRLETSESFQPDTVHTVLYLLFNVGFQTAREDYEKGKDLCEQALYLAHMLQTQKISTAETHALLALMYFNLARFDHRTNVFGELLLLQDQDRSCWDKKMIALGFQYLADSRKSNTISVYHLEAGIASVHCTGSYESTDWQTILMYYDQLVKLKPDPVVKLNRSIPVYHLHGVQKAMEELIAIEDEKEIQSYNFYFAVRGVFEITMRNKEAAVKSLQRGLSLSKYRLEKEFINERIQNLLGNNG